MKRESTKWSALWNCVKDKNNFLMKRNISFFKQKYIALFLETYIFKISKNLIALTFFFAEGDTKKDRYASAKALALPVCRGKFQTLRLNRSLKMMQLQKSLCPHFWNSDDKKAQISMEVDF